MKLVYLHNKCKISVHVKNQRMLEYVIEFCKYCRDNDRYASEVTRLCTVIKSKFILCKSVAFSVIISVESRKRSVSRIEEKKKSASTPLLECMGLERNRIKQCAVFK